MPIDKTKITKNMVEKAKQCRTADELIALAKTLGYEITKEEALGRLVYAIPNDQACLRTQAAIDRLLRFSGSEAL